MKMLLLTLACCFALIGNALAQGSSEGGYLPVSIADALTAYGKLTGTTVLFDNTVQGQIDLPKFQGINDERQAELIEKAIFLNGFCMFDAGDHVVSVLGLGKQPRDQGLPVYTKPEELPTRERVFSYVFRLEHRSPQHLASVLQQYTPPINAVAITPDEEAHTILVTGTTSVVRRFIRLVSLLDIPGVATGGAAPQGTPHPTSPPNSGN